MIITIHGVSFVRSGECKKCGVCEDGACPHWNADTKLCRIYNNREQFCERCDSTHQVCIDFPNHAWLTVIKNGSCGYMFTPLNEEEAEKKKRLDEVWQ